MTQLILYSLLVSGLCMSMFYPILIPNEVIEAVKGLLLPIWAWNGLFPIQAIFNIIVWTMEALIAFLMFKFVTGVMALLTGSGKPEI